MNVLVRLFNKVFNKVFVNYLAVSVIVDVCLCRDTNNVTETLNILILHIISKWIDPDCFLIKYLINFLTYIFNIKINSVWTHILNLY